MLDSLTSLMKQTDDTNVARAPAVASAPKTTSNILSLPMAGGNATNFSISALSNSIAMLASPKHNKVGTLGGINKGQGQGGASPKNKGALADVLGAAAAAPAPAPSVSMPQ